MLAAANLLSLVKQTNFIVQVGSYLEHKVDPFVGIMRWTALIHPDNFVWSYSRFLLDKQLLVDLAGGIRSEAESGTLGQAHGCG